MKTVIYLSIRSICMQYFICTGSSSIFLFHKIIIKIPFFKRDLFKPFYYVQYLVFSNNFIVKHPVQKILNTTNFHTKNNDVNILFSVYKRAQRSIAAAADRPQTKRCRSANRSWCQLFSIFKYIDSNIKNDLPLISCSR